MEEQSDGQQERARWLEGVRAEPRHWRTSVAVGATFAVQTAIATGILYAGYHAAGTTAGLTWAIVSAVIVFQPELHQSLAASLSRIAANVIGAGAGLAIGRLRGTTTFDIAIAMAVTAVTCGLLRLDNALRTACVASVVVMSTNINHGDLAASGLERFVSVTIGCLVAVLIQFSSHGFWLLMPRKRERVENRMASNSAE